MGKGVHPNEVYEEKYVPQNKNSEWKEVHAHYCPEGIEDQRRNKTKVIRADL